VAHPDQLAFFGLVAAAFPQHVAGSVLDIGSLDINGGPHTLIHPREYVGVDLGAGPNVTLVGRAEDLDLDSDSFDVAMSSECFEHNPAWPATLRNMIRMTRPSGLIAFSCATTGRPEHGTTRSDRGFGAPLAVSQGQEHYRNVTGRQARRAIPDAALAAAFTAVNVPALDLYLVGVKAPALPADLARLDACREAVLGWLGAPVPRGQRLTGSRRRLVHGLAGAIGDANVERLRRLRVRDA
jgi:SAM-dependent methyltransferase